MNKIEKTSDNPLMDYKISPEIFEVATEYVKHLDTAKTARALGISRDIVVGILDKREVKRYVDAIFLEQGYMQRNKLNDIMEQIIDKKLEEMQESDLGSSKDISELIKLAHTMRMDYNKQQDNETPGTQVNIQQNFGGDNYNNLLQKLVTGDNL